MHMHSTASDGTDTPETLVNKCAKLKLSLCSITDHDTIDAHIEAVPLAKKLKLPFITGVEFSVRHKGELHVLGYGVDITSSEFLKEMELLRESREGRVHAIIEALDKNGIPITFEDVERHAKGDTMGRPHVAAALAEHGYAENIPDAFARYLNEDGIAYVKRRKLNAKQAIDLILNAGGTPVLAHPKFIQTDDIEKLILQLKDDGLMGIEAYYPAHSDAEAQYFESIALKNDMIVTAGSDYHGKMRELSAIASERRKSPALDKSVEYLKSKYVY